MVYGAGFASADDVVAHELAHGVIQRTAGLIYWFQSGALNESMADVLGELVDLADGVGTDTPQSRWQLGEDLPPQAGGVTRDMSDPTLYGQPDHTASELYDFATDYLDNGGVHTNSGVPNKAAYLVVDGTVGEPGGRLQRLRVPRHRRGQGSGPVLDGAADAHPRFGLHRPRRRPPAVLPQPGCCCGGRDHCDRLPERRRGGRGHRPDAVGGADRAARRDDEAGHPLGDPALVGPRVRRLVAGQLLRHPHQSLGRPSRLRPGRAVRAIGAARGSGGGVDYTFRLVAVTADGTSPSVLRRAAGSALRVAWPGGVTFGSALRVRGALTGAGPAPVAGRTVRLMRRDGGSGPWERVAADTTGPSGGFVLTARPRRGARYVVTYAGTATQLGARSAVRRVEVRQRVGLDVDRTLRRGDTAVFRGAVSPARSDGVVRLQRRQADGTWRTVDTRPAHGAQPLRAVGPGDGPALDVAGGRGGPADGRPGRRAEPDRHAAHQLRQKLSRGDSTLFDSPSRDRHT